MKKALKTIRRLRTGVVGYFASRPRLKIAIKILLVVFAFLAGSLLGNMVLVKRPNLKKLGIEGINFFQSTPKPDPGKIKPPSSSASEKERQEFSSAVAVAAVDAESVSLKDCNASPRIASVKIPFNLVNEDSSDHKVRISGEEFVIKANSTYSFETFLSQGIYGLGCDSEEVGFLLLGQR